MFINNEAIKHIKKFSSINILYWKLKAETRIDEKMRETRFSDNFTLERLLKTNEIKLSELGAMSRSR